MTCPVASAPETRRMRSSPRSERIRDLTQRPDFGARRAARAVRADKSAIGMLALGIKRASPKGRNHDEQVNELIVAFFR